MSEVQASAVKNMNNFFCGLHLLVSLAENTSKTLFDLEKKELETPIGADNKANTKFFIKKSESAIIRAIQTACKLLSRGGDEKNGCYAEFSSYGCT